MPLGWLDAWDTVPMLPCAALSDWHCWCSEQSPGSATVLAARHCCSHGPQVPANTLHTVPSVSRECCCCHGSRAFTPRGWMAQGGCPRSGRYGVWPALGCKVLLAWAGCCSVGQLGQACPCQGSAQLLDVAGFVSLWPSTAGICSEGCYCLSVGDRAELRPLGNDSKHFPFVETRELRWSPAWRWKSWAFDCVAANLWCGKTESDREAVSEIGNNPVRDGASCHAKLSSLAQTTIPSMPPASPLTFPFPPSSLTTPTHNSPSTRDIHMWPKGHMADGP